MGRPKLFCQEDALEKALLVFWESGYEGASLDDLLNAMQISKGSFYHSYGSKKALFKRVLQLYNVQCQEKLALMRRDYETASGFIVGLFRQVALDPEGAISKLGCLAMNSAIEFSQRDIEIRDLIIDYMKMIEAFFAVQLSEAKKNNEINSHLPIQEYAQFLVQNLNGLVVMQRASYGNEKGLASVEFIEKMLFVEMRAS